MIADAVTLNKKTFCSGQAERLACHWQPNAFCGLTPTPTFSARGPKGREKKKPPMFGPMSRCVPSFGRGQQPCTPDGLGLVSGICGGRKKKQDKGQASKPPLCPVTSARSAGSYGGFSGDRKWGQKQTAGISFRVTFPESLETRRKSRGHTGDIQGFLLRCHTVPAGAPLRNCGAENKIGFQPDSQVVTFLIIDA